MTNWFFFLALTITLIFVVTFIIIFYCSIIIYKNVEKAFIDDQGENNE